METSETEQHDTTIRYSTDSTALSARTVTTLSDRDGTPIAEAPSVEAPSVSELSGLREDHQGIYCDLHMDSPGDYEPSWPEQVGTVVATLREQLSETIGKTPDEADVRVQYRRNATEMNIRIDFGAL